MHEYGVAASFGCMDGANLHIQTYQGTMFLCPGPKLLSATKVLDGRSCCLSCDYALISHDTTDNKDP